ncbi:TetR/AcrR family transcriptional regulator [Paenibacillus terrigena]|uniref:TetR/AcrR family transcriptional regulator n=1 Tax=Paenibacillus terrigena TaxID=369333 RepID=UPI00035CAD2E|nr:TetR/AcrR family transcriptional regulator [Paenibacillus terrigena]
MATKRSDENQPESPLDERREQIKKAALKVFAQRGIAGTKMSMIASEAGISQGLSYRYFSSKEELFVVLVQDALEEAQTAIKQIHQLPGSPLAQIKALTIQMLDENHKQYFLLLRQAQTSKDVPLQAKQLLEQYSSEDTIRLLVPIFMNGQQAGEFREGSAERLLFLYFSVVTGLMLQDVNLPEGYWVQEVDYLMRILTK